MFFSTELLIEVQLPRSQQQNESADSLSQRHLILIAKLIYSEQAVLEVLSFSPELALSSTQLI